MATRSTQSAYDIEMIRQERDAARAELAALRATVAALTASRADLMSQLAACGNADPPNGDSAAAYRRGWCDAREASAGASDKFASATRMKLPAPFGGLHDPDQDGFETASPFVKWTAQSISNAIRAMQPPTAQTEHDSAEDHRSYAVEAWHERM